MKGPRPKGPKGNSDKKKLKKEKGAQQNGYPSLFSIKIAN